MAASAAGASSAASSSSALSSFANRVAAASFLTSCCNCPAQRRAPAASRSWLEPSAAAYSTPACRAGGSAAKPVPCGSATHWRSTSTPGLDSTRARAVTMACSACKTEGLLAVNPPEGRRDCMSAMRCVVNGWLRRYGQLPLSLMRLACCSLSNMPTKPSGAKPAGSISPMPTRSASRSMSREKLSWFCRASACPPTTSACVAPGFLLAAKAPSTIAPSSSGVWRLCCVSKREMCRCVTWLNSCAITEASSSRVPTTPIKPRCSPR